MCDQSRWPGPWPARSADPQGDEQVLGHARAETRVHACAYLGARYGFVTACVRQHQSDGRASGDRFSGIAVISSAERRWPLSASRLPAQWIALAVRAALLTATSFVRHDGDGNVVLDTRVGGSELLASDARWSGPFPPHSLENVGDAELRVIMVELKDPA